MGRGRRWQLCRCREVSKVAKRLLLLLLPGWRWSIWILRLLLGLLPGLSLLLRLLTVRILRRLLLLLLLLLRLIPEWTRG